MESICVYEIKFCVFIQGKINVNSLCLLIHQINVLSNKKAVHIQFICSLMITDSINQWINVCTDTELA